MRASIPIGYADLADTFCRQGPAIDQVGVEIECGLLNPRTGRAVSYVGPHGSHQLLVALQREMSGQPIFEGSSITGVVLPGGQQFTLELGGALEYSSAPHRSVATVIDFARSDLLAASELARGLDIAIVPTGLSPFTAMSQIPWAPKPRIGIMRKYFRGRGAAGALAEGVMGLTLSTQTTVDYVSQSDLFEKLRLHVTAGPIAAALFVNSPLQEGQLTGALSRRLQLWQLVDPKRCGILDLALEPAISISDLVRWAASIPMIYRIDRKGRYIAAPDVAFVDLIGQRFADGRELDRADWESHLGQMWPFVRVRRTLEQRICDTQSWQSIGSAPAFWTGLTYDSAVRANALKLLEGIDADELRLTTRDVAVRGLAATVAGQTVGEIAERLLGLAQCGLRARVVAGVEPPEAVDLLMPCFDTIGKARTPAQDLAGQWVTSLRRRPDAFVSEYRITSI